MILTGWKPDYIVGLTRGGLHPANLLSQVLKVPMCSLDVSLRDSVMEPTSNAWMAEDAFNGKKILIVDDINDTGATLQWIVNDWQSMCMPGDNQWNKVFAIGGNVRFAAVVDNEASKFRDISYYSLVINKEEKDVWVEFPWENWWEEKPV